MFENILSKASEYIESGYDLELVEILDSTRGTPRGKGAFMFVDENCESFGTVGGGNVEYNATLYAKELLLKKESCIKEYNMSQKGSDNIGMVCGGDAVFRFTYLTNDLKSKDILRELKEKNVRRNKVYIFGCGHVSMELAKMLDYLGFDVIVWDDRSEFANAERFKVAKRIICKPYDDILNEIDVTENDFIVIMTRGHIYDYIVEKQVLKSKANYIGAIGSRNKTKVINEKLLDEGFKKEDIDRVCAPIGLSIAADTVEEIAVSISAEILLFRAKLEKRRKVYDENSLLKIYPKS